MIQTQPLDVKDFSGGITDNSLDGSVSQARELINLMLTNQGHLKPRPGSLGWTPSIAAARLNLLIPYDEVREINYFMQSGRRLFRTIGESSGPYVVTVAEIEFEVGSGTVKPLFTATHLAANRSSFAEWKRHVFITSDELATPQRPQKIFRDQTDTYRLRTAGLPPLQSNPAFLFSKYAFVTTDISPSTDTMSIPGGNLAVIGNTLNVMNLFQVNDQVRITTTGTMPGGLTSGTIYYVYSLDNSGYPAASGIQLKTTPSSTTPVDITSVGSGTHTLELVSGRFNYLYAFVYSNEYTVDSVELTTFKDFGPVTYVQVASASPPGMDFGGPLPDPIPITSLPALANTGIYVGQHFPLTTIQKEIYRTVDNGTTFYKVGFVANATTTYSDVTPDTNLINGEILYTSGGVLDNDLPPPAKYLHIVNNIAYYGFIKEGTQTLGRRVRQSVADDPDSCPGSLFEDFDSEVTGISSHKNIPIILCRDEIYRLNGTFDELGRGSMDSQKISDTVGCVSHLSCVQTPLGVFFAGRDGFYLTDGWQVIPVSTEFKKTYQTLTTLESVSKDIYGIYDSQNLRVIWAVCSDPAGIGENDSWYVLDLNFGSKFPFTTAEGGAGFRPTSLMFFNKHIYRGDTHGFSIKHFDTVLYDATVDAANLDVYTWNRQPIDYLYESCALTFGSPFERKWVPRINLLGGNETNVAIQITSINDDGRKVQELAPIIVRYDLDWGENPSRADLPVGSIPLFGEDVYWGEDQFLWNYQGVLDQWRHFPAGGLRCETKAIRIENATIKLYWSDLVGTATIFSIGATGTATLDGAGREWPEDPIGWSLYFAIDNYTNPYVVTARTDTVLTFTNSHSVPLNLTASPWELHGKHKDQTLELVSYQLHYAFLSKTQKASDSAQLGGNS